MTPQISVVVPTHRRPELLARCLGALTMQTLPAQDFEVIVVHDGPDEATQRLVARYAGQSDVAIRFDALNERRGPAAARNGGWRQAHGAIIAFTDDDTVPSTTWLESAVDALVRGTDAGWGRLVVPLGSAPTDYEIDAAGLATAPFVTANCFVRRTMLERLGGFDERFERAWREDSDLYFRLLAAHARIAYVASAVVEHPIRPAPWGVSISQQRKIQFDALLYKKHPDLYRARIRARPRWDYYAVVTALGITAVAAIAGAPLVAALAGSAWLMLTARFCGARLARATKRPAHVAEMVVTSAVIPPLAVFWRLLGAIRYRIVLL